jgi:branched-chain amino acid transport system substrate-binding protein
MNTKTSIGIIVLIVLVIGGWMLLKGGKSASETGSIKIGVSMPLSGEAASYGEAGRAGLMLALKEINDAGGIDGRQVELVIEDDKCGAAGAAAFQKLITVDKVSALIGPVCSPAAGAANPVSREAGIPNILIGASAPGVAGGDDSTFSGYASDSLQGKFVAEYVYNTLGKKSVAILYVKNDWGEGLQTVFAKRFTELGGTIVLNEGAAPDTRDVKSILTKIKAAKPDLVYLPAFPALATISLKQMKEMDITVPVMGGDALESDEFLTSGVADSVMFVTGAVGNPDDFKAKVKAVSGEDAVINIITPLAYDALKMYAKVIDERGTDAKDIIAGLNALEYKDGVSFARVSFDKNGDLEEASYDVKVVKGTTVEILK